MHTYQLLTDHNRPTDHYRHISQLRTSTGRPARKGVTLSAIPRILSVPMALAVAIGVIVGTGLAPSANALPCSAPEANIEPPSAPPAMPAPAPVVRPPMGRRPSNANERAPLPKLGPLIAGLLKPGQKYSAPLR